MNLLTDPILTLSSGARVSLPALFATMARGEIKGFSALRPHQRPAWHMFLVQLAALALWNTDHDEIPDDEAAWASALRCLTPDHSDDAPWRLAVDDETKPAFLQAPKTQGLKWSEVATPDALDMLITSRNHDLKQMVAEQASAEDWVYALISLQTCEGFGGRTQYGIVRMNGGSSSRPLVGLVPANRMRDLFIDPSAWWKRDLKLLLTTRAKGHNGIGTPGGRALLWCFEWREGTQLDLRLLDPWFIEVCRRIRLSEINGKLTAFRAGSKNTRIDGKAFRGNTGDPWTPIHVVDGKSLTLGVDGEFNYQQLVKLLYSGEWKMPLLARPGNAETGDMLLVAEAFARGNCKTGGFKSRTIPVPNRVLSLFQTELVGKIAEAQIKEIETFSVALRDALALVVAGGARDFINSSNGKKLYAHVAPARKRFDQEADCLFFPSLWRRASVVNENVATKYEERRAFLSSLKKAANNEFRRALPALPCPTIFRPRAEARARRAFHNRIWKKYPELFDRKQTNE